MKTLSITVLGILFSFSAFSTETNLLCNDQNGHSVYRLQINEKLTTAKLITLIGDSSVLAEGCNELKFEEGESSENYASFSGKTNSGLVIVLQFNAKKAASMEGGEIVDVSTYYQKKKDDILSGRTTLLCGKQ